MRQGKSIAELAAEIMRQSETKKDYIVDTAGLQAYGGADLTIGFNTNVGKREDFKLTNWGHQQLSSTTGIPKQYYERLKASDSNLLAENVNHWLRKEPSKRMVRVLDGNIRAILSDRYRPLDYIDLAENALKKIQSMNAEIASSELTETKLYIKALMPKISGEIKKGDVVQMGISISNSEVGAGSVRFEPLIYRLACTNGLIISDSKVRKYHIGRMETEIGEFLRTETRQQLDRGFWMQISDIMDNILTKEFFDKQVDKLRISTGEKIVGNPVEAVEVTAKTFGFNADEQGGVLRHLIEGGDLSKYGLLNAVTRYSQDIKMYDRATQFEQFGGEILELTKNQWDVIATAK